MAVCSVTEIEPEKLPPLGVIVGVATVATVGAFTARLKFVVLRLGDILNESLFSLLL